MVLVRSYQKNITCVQRHTISRSLIDLVEAGYASARFGCFTALGPLGVWVAFCFLMCPSCVLKSCSFVSFLVGIVPASELF